MTTLLDRPTTTAVTTTALVRHLNSRGYTVDWIARRIDEPHLLARLVNEVVDEQLHQHVEAVCRAYGHRDTTPDEAGLPDPAHWTADAPADPRMPEYDVEMPWRQRGDLPGFDRHGNFDPRFLPGHRWAKADDLVGRLHDALRLILNGPAGAKAVEDETGIYPEQQTHLRERLGLKLQAYDIGGGEAGRPSYRLVERHDGALAHAQAVLAQMDAALAAEDDTLIGVALEHELVATYNSDVDEATPRIVNNHPAVRAWRATRSKDSTAA